MSWQIADHVCKVCLGRLLVAEQSGRQIVRCSNCGAEAEGPVTDLCCCGVKLKSGKSAGLRCVRNAEKTAQLPGEIIAVAMG